jgi:hypothetical protein
VPFPSGLTHLFVMAGLVPAIHALFFAKREQERRGCPGIRAFTPVFDGLMPGHDGAI